jgi:hypothetical protein
MKILFVKEQYYITILNMFRASLCSSSGRQLYIYSIWYRHTLYAAIQCTDQERTAVRYCKYTIVLLKMSTAMLETC